MCRHPDASARWLLIDGGVDGKDMRVRVRTRSCGLAALGCWSYAARSVGGVGVVLALMSLPSAFIPGNVLFGQEVFFGASTYHRREFVITAEH